MTTLERDAVKDSLGKSGIVSRESEVTERTEVVPSPVLKPKPAFRNSNFVINVVNTGCDFRGKMVKQKSLKGKLKHANGTCQLSLFYVL